MKYALLIYHQPDAMDGLPEEELLRSRGEFWAIQEDPGCLDGAQLAPVGTATTLREHDGQQLVTDGPFADTKEVLGGFYLIEAPDLDAATALAQRIPITRYGGAVEIRPLAPVPAGS